MRNHLLAGLAVTTMAAGMSAVTAAPAEAAIRTENCSGKTVVADYAVYVRRQPTTAKKGPDGKPNGIIGQLDKGNRAECLQDFLSGGVFTDCQAKSERLWTYIYSPKHRTRGYVALSCTSLKK